MNFERFVKLDKRTLEALKTIFGYNIYSRLLFGKEVVEGVVELKVSNGHLEVRFTENGHLCECCGDALASICWDCHYNRMDEEKAPLEQRINELESEIDDLKYRLTDRESELERFRRLFDY